VVTRRRGLVSSAPAQFDVYLISFDPAKGAEVGKTRPAVVVSPNEMNRNIETVIVAPLTSTQRAWPTRIALKFAGKRGDVALDQLRAVDRSRLVKCLGRVSVPDAISISAVLVQMFQHP
jgi:mRNA interferase MazF